MRSCKVDHGDRGRGNSVRSTYHVPFPAKSSRSSFSYSVRVSQHHYRPGVDSSGWIWSMDRNKLSNFNLCLAVHDVKTFGGLLVNPDR